MNFRRKTAVSVIVATLILIAISVAAAVMVYVFVGGLAGNFTQNGGQSVTEKLTIQSYTFAANPGTCGCNMQLIEIFLLNPGPSTTIISNVYYDGNLIAWGGSALPNSGSPKNFAANSWFGTTSQSTLGGTSTGPAYYFNASPAPASQLSYSATNAGEVVIGLAAAATYGSGHSIKVVSTTGAANVFTVVAGISG